MKVCIVGHGPSLHLCDIVVRLKGGDLICRSNPEDYGTKFDFLVASTEILGCFQDAAPRLGNWGYPKYSWYNEEQVERVASKCEKGIEVPLNLCNYWNFMFRQLGGKHPNVSTGCAAVIIAAHVLRPKEILLAGFDTLMDPTKPFTRADGIPRSGSGPFPNHDWEIEKVLLASIARTYNVEIKNIASFN
jgi:hypothetical protein